jgi:heme A synthase
LGALRIAPGDRRGRSARRAAYALTVVQVLFGAANLWMLAPIWMQLVHLLLADLLWIALVLAIVSALARSRDEGRGVGLEP